MNYADALNEWGRQKLVETALERAEFSDRAGQSFRLLSRSQAEIEAKIAEIGTSPEFQKTIEMIAAGPVTVTTFFNEGSGCCGPMAESASAEIVVLGSGLRAVVDFDGFDLTEFVGEVVAAGGGTITNS